MGFEQIKGGKGSHEKWRNEKTNTNVTVRTMSIAATWPTQC